ncbi:MAG: TIGR04255 family protein [Phycisphaerae bacterium]|jgi:uncharacterized protein (TIGR04255 family)
MPSESARTELEFERPPVIEVVCGVLFKPLESMLAPHLGVLWERFKATYPTCQEVPPLAPAIERFDDSAGVEFTISDKPPLPRVWFVHESETGIIQVQRDRFLHNWKKVHPEDEYPRYTNVIELFREHLSTFDLFVTEVESAGVEPLQYELTYVNHILQGEGFDSLGRIGSVLPDFAWRTADERFLPTPERVSWRTSFTLPDKAGRLHATIRNGVRNEDEKPLLLLELTARGFGKDGSRAEMWKWFDLGHEWIVRAFADLTDAGVQRDVWKRIK